MITNGSFPADFVWGAATASYQIEGAVEADGRGESIWDRFSHTPGRTLNGDTGDVACDHYHRFAEDIELMSSIGLKAYRFSVAWPRVLPEGTGPVNHKGLDFYDRLVDALLEHNITPFLTLYHWDLPQVLEDRGGWPERTIVGAFADYARTVANRLGDRVSYFATLNEPFVVANLGYRWGQFAPGRIDPPAAAAAAHHLLLAHGEAVGAIKEAAPGAEVGIVLNFEAKHPASSHLFDLEAAAIAHDQANRWFLDPLSGRGYPEAGRSAWGWDQAEIMPGDMERIAAPLDFMGVNYYTREVVRSPLLPAVDQVPTARTGMGWEVYPQGLTEVLGFVASRTEAMPIYVTENGAAYPLDPADPTRDPERTGFLIAHLRAALAALEQGVQLKGYFAWSLLDNFEWAHGYSQRFGLVHVDYTSLERRIRDSGRFWSRMARGGALPG